MMTASTRPTSAPFLPIHFVRELRHPLVRAEEKSVLFAIASRLRDQDATTWPTLETIAADAGVAKDTAMLVVQWALKIGVLVLVNDGRRGRVYQLDCDRLVNLPVDVERRATTPWNASKHKKTFCPTEAEAVAIPATRTPNPGHSNAESQALGRTNRTNAVLATRIHNPGAAVSASQQLGPKDQEKLQKKDQRERGGGFPTNEQDPWGLEPAPPTPRSPTLAASAAEEREKHPTEPADMRGVSVAPPAAPVLPTLDRDASSAPPNTFELLPTEPGRRRRPLTAKTPKPAPEPRAPKMTNAERFRRYTAAFRQGYSRGVGRDVSVDAIKGPEHIIVQALQAHAKNAAGERLTGDDVLEWLEHRAEEFGRAAGVVPYIYLRFNDFLNGVKTAPWRRDTGTQPAALDINNSWKTGLPDDEIARLHTLPTPKGFE